MPNLTIFKCFSNLLAKAVSFNKTIRLSTYYTGKERTLVRNCLQGHRRAQRRLYDAYVDAVFHTCLRICGGTADVSPLLHNHLPFARDTAARNRRGEQGVRLAKSEVGDRR